ncbi:MAG: hypothetical protein ABI641_08590 [Caldimonas sp.]
MAQDPAQAALPAGLSANAFSSVFQAINGLRNRRAIVALLGCTIVGVLVSVLLVAMAGTIGFFAAFLGGVFYLLAVGTGVNAAGLLQMDQARGIASRSLVDALVYGLMCIPKLIVLGLALVAVEIAIFILIAIVLFICKIPYFGPLLFVVAFPLSVVVAGVTIWGLFLCLLLSLPAIWQGATITRALAQTLAIVRSRLIEAVLLLVVLGFLCAAVGFILFALLFGGLMPTLGMSAGIVGFGGIGMQNLSGMMYGMGGMGRGGGHMVAGMIGGAVLWAIAGSLVGQVYLLGLSIVYLRLTEGLDLTASEEALRTKFDEARRRTAELGERARAAAGAAAASATAPSATAAAPPPFQPPPAYAPPPAAAPGMAPPAMPAAPVAGSGTTGTDIDLPFDDARPAPAYGAPPAYMPPPVQAPPAPPAAAPVTACPQCLSAVTADDVFCGVCGYRLK